MKKVAVVMSLVVGLLLLGMMVDYCWADTPEIPGKIAYIQDGNIWIAKANGDSPQRLTTTGDCSDPSWSPDGTRIAYLRRGHDGEDDWGRNIWIINADGSNPQQLTTTKDCEEFTWSPDGTKIAYIRSPEEVYASYLWCYDLTTRSAARVVPDRHCWKFEWSPDSKWIAFLVDLTGDRGGPPTCRLEICSLSGQNRKTIIKKADGISFVWSSDSRCLYLSSLSNDWSTTTFAAVELADSPRLQMICEAQLGDPPDSGFEILQLINEEEIVLFETDVDNEVNTGTFRIAILNTRNREFKKETIEPRVSNWVYSVYLLGDTKKFWMTEMDWEEYKGFLTLVVNGKVVKTIEGEQISWIPSILSILTALVEED